MHRPFSPRRRALRVFAGRLVLLAGAAAAILVLQRTGLEPAYDLVRLFSATPHERYAATLRLEGLDETYGGAQWLEAARSSIQEPERMSLPRSQAIAFAAQRPDAAAFEVTLRRGQRYVAEAEVTGADRTSVFLDVFERDGQDLRHFASAAADERALILEMRADANLVLRVQPELQRAVRVTLTLRAEPTLRLPVADAARPRIQSFFGDARDNGNRRHHGVDIFAARGTPVVAAAEGVVSSVGTNGLGGNVVWIARPTRGEAHYYAHLDRQLVTVGTFVRKGDVIGTVGNTGNARGTPPHLHFGIYASGGAVDPLPYLRATGRVTGSRAAAD